MKNYSTLETVPVLRLEGRNREQLKSRTNCLSCSWMDK